MSDSLEQPNALPTVPNETVSTARLAPSALPASAGSGARDKRLMSAVTGLMEIVEGVRCSTWGCDGRRLVDTPEWCELYCAWNAEKRKPLNEKLTHGRCPWSENSNGAWATGCGNLYEVNDGTPLENKMNFCCFCGRKLTEARYVDDIQGDHDDEYAVELAAKQANEKGQPPCA